jgi:hypothetical protein
VAAELDALLAPKSAIACGQRDALALALALDGTPILTCSEERDAEPELCRQLTPTGWGAERLVFDRRVAELEREAWQTVLASAQCASLLCSGLELALVYLHAPLFFAQAPILGVEHLEQPSRSDARRILGDVRLYWYPL